MSSWPALHAIVRASVVQRMGNGAVRSTSLVVAGMLLLAVLRSTAAPTTVLGQLAATMKPGTWAELETSGYNSALIEVQGSDILGYADVAAWDPSSEQVLFVGQGHYAALKFITYSAMTNSWTLMPTPPWWKGDSQTGQGPIGHAYGNNAIDPNASVLYFHQSSTRLVHRYAIAKGQWSTLAEIPGETAHGTALAYFPEMKALVRVLNGTIHMYREETRSWSLVRSNLQMGPYHNVAVYNGPRHSVILGGGNGSTDLYEFDARGKITKLPPPSLPVRVGSTLVTADPVTGDLLLVDIENSRFVGLDLEKKQWRALPSPPIGEGAVAAISTYGVNLYFGNDPAKVFLYKHAARASP